MRTWLGGAARPLRALLLVLVFPIFVHFQPLASRRPGPQSQKDSQKCPTPCSNILGGCMQVIWNTYAHAYSSGWRGTAPLGAFASARFPNFRPFPATCTAPTRAPEPKGSPEEPNAVIQHPWGMYASDLEHLCTLQCVWVAWHGPFGRFCLCLFCRFSLISSHPRRADQDPRAKRIARRAQRRVPTSLGDVCK